MAYLSYRQWSKVLSGVNMVIYMVNTTFKLKVADLNNNIKYRNLTNRMVFFVELVNNGIGM
jgi:hypothetical protein